MPRRPKTAPQTIGPYTWRGWDEKRERHCYSTDPEVFPVRWVGLTDAQLAAPDMLHWLGIGLYRISAGLPETRAIKRLITRS